MEQSNFYTARIADGNGKPFSHPESILGELVGRPLRRFEAEYLIGVLAIVAPNIQEVATVPMPETDLPALWFQAGTEGETLALSFHPMPDPAKDPGELFALFGYDLVNGERRPLAKPLLDLGPFWWLPRSEKTAGADMVRFFQAFPAEICTRRNVRRAGEGWEAVADSEAFDGQAVIYGAAPSRVLGYHVLQPVDVLRFKAQTAPAGGPPQAEPSQLSPALTSAEGRGA